MAEEESSQKIDVLLWFYLLIPFIGVVVNGFVREPAYRLFIIAASALVIALYMGRRRNGTVAWFLSFSLLTALFGGAALINPLLPWRVLTAVTVLAAVVLWLVLHAVSLRRAMQKENSSAGESG